MLFSFHETWNVEPLLIEGVARRSALQGTLGVIESRFPVSPLATADGKVHPDINPNLFPNPKPNLLLLLLLLLLLQKY